MPQLIIDAEFKGLIADLTADEMAQLEANIKKEGCRDSLVVWVDRDITTLIDGHNRYDICKRNKIDFEVTPLHFEDRNDAIEWIITNQLGRRNINNYQRGVLALRKEEVIKSRAKANQKSAAVSTNEKRSGTLPPNSAEALKPIETRVEIAKIAGIGHDTIDKVKKIESMATPEMKEQLRKGDMTVHKAYGLVTGNADIKRQPEKEKDYRSRNSITQSLQAEKELKEIARTVNEKYTKDQRKLFISFIKI
ncbi:MAG: hypothetical protein H0X41_03155 [Chitinophagaceae bacterium]|nr:hypothetical protein [Chitinophagaceae bacterium]